MAIQRKPPASKQKNHQAEAPYALRGKPNNTQRWVLLSVTILALCVVYAWKSFPSAAQKSATLSDTPASAASNTTSEFQPLAYLPEAQTISSTDCSDPFALDQAVHVYAIGNVRGKQQGNGSDTMAVTLQDTSAPLVLILGAQQPAVWTLFWETGVDIRGIVLTGESKQHIVGLPRDIPVLHSSSVDATLCGHAYVGKGQEEKLQALAQNTLGFPIEKTFFSHDGEVTVPMGRALPLQKMAPAAQGLSSQNAHQSPAIPSGFQGPTLPEGQAGLQEAVRLGLLRPAMDADEQKWLLSHRQHFGMNSKDAKIMPAPRRFVILKEMRLPDGLHGGHSAVFFLPSGVPFPHGDLGHSRLYNMGNGTCMGLICGSDF